MTGHERQAAPARRGQAAGTVVSVGLGVAVAVQARINGELGQRIDDGVVAALLSFLGGLLLLVLLVAMRPQMRQGLRRVAAALRDQHPGDLGDQHLGDRWLRPYPLRPYQLLGGVCGSFVVICQGLTVAIIGVAVFTVALVAGQTVSALLVDRAGVGPGGPRVVSGRRIAGAVLAVAAVVLAVSDQFGAPQALWPALLPALAGVGAAWQQAVNGLVGAAARHDGPALDGMLPAALVNFGVGTAALGLAAAVEVAMRGPPDPLPAQPWLYLGGLLGVLFIATAAAIVPITGVLLLGLGAVAGQLVGALLLDMFLPTAGNQITATTLIGTALTLVAVTVIALPGRRRT